MSRAGCCSKLVSSGLGVPSGWHLTTKFSGFTSPCTNLTAHNTEGITSPLAICLHGTAAIKPVYLQARREAVMKTGCSRPKMHAHGLWTKWPKESSCESQTVMSCYDQLVTNCRYSCIYSRSADGTRRSRNLTNETGVSNAVRVMADCHQHLNRQNGPPALPKETCSTISEALQVMKVWAT